jgi:hypothetical protein
MVYSAAMQNALGSRRNATLVLAALVIFGALYTSIQAAAQWVRYPTPGLPRKADGTVNMAAATPRTADGKPDFSGTWTSDEVDARRPKEPPNPYDATTSRRMRDIGIELQGGLPYQPWLATLVKQRTANNSKDDPHVRCMPDNFLRSWGMPHLIKFVHTPNLLLILNEWNSQYRQIYTDARPLPVDPTPSWQGYSSAKWDGDTLVVDTIGFRDDLWIDWNGSVITEKAKVREEYRRPDFAHLEIRVTVDDPKAYTKPWTVLIKERAIVDVDLIDEICLENEKDVQHLNNTP